MLSTSAKADFLKSIRDKPSQLTDAGKAHLAFESNWLIGDGTIQDAVGQKGKVPASGSIGLQHESARYDNNVLGLERETSVERFLVFYGFGTSVDTVRGDKPTTFATAILPPSVVGRRLSFFGDYSALWAIPKKVQRLEQQWGIRAYAGLAKMTWDADSSGQDIVDDVALYTAGTRFVIVPINRSHDDNRVVFSVETGPTFRYVDFKRPNGERLRASGLSGENHFAGWDVLATLQIRDFVASFYLPMFGAKGRAAGLRDAGPAIQVGVQTALVKLTDDSEVRKEAE